MSDEFPFVFALKDASVAVKAPANLETGDMSDVVAFFDPWTEASVVE